MRPGCRIRSVTESPCAGSDADTRSNSKADADFDSGAHGNSHGSQCD